jgi:hypothetical protein
MQIEKMFHIYEGSFGGVFHRDGLGLQGAGRLFINGEQGTVEISAENPLPMLITLSLTLIPFSRLFRTLYRPSRTYAFSINQIQDLTGQGRVIRFRAPNSKGQLKRVSFTAQSLAEAQEIETVLRGISIRMTSPPLGG